MEAVENFINSGAEPAERMIRDLVECELAYINTDHAQFIGGSRAIGMVMERRSRMPEDEATEDAAAKPNHGPTAELAVARHHGRNAGNFSIEAFRNYVCFAFCQINTQTCYLGVPTTCILFFGNPDLFWCRHESPKLQRTQWIGFIRSTQ